jgi:hypothetical protein
MGRVVGHPWVTRQTRFYYYYYFYLKGKVVKATEKKMTKPNLSFSQDSQHLLQCCRPSLVFSSSHFSSVLRTLSSPTCLCLPPLITLSPVHFRPLYLSLSDSLSLSSPLTPALGSPPLVPLSAVPPTLYFESLKMSHLSDSVCYICRICVLGQ